MYGSTVMLSVPTRTTSKNIDTIPSFSKIATYHQDPWGISANLNFFGLFITQSFTNSNQRYLCLCPDEAEDFVDYLISVERLDDAAVLLGKIVNDNDFVSKKGKSNHTLWHELCKLISKNPKKISSLNVDAVSFYIQTKINKRSATII